MLKRYMKGKAIKILAYKRSYNRILNRSKRKQRGKISYILPATMGIYDTFYGFDTYEYVKQFEKFQIFHINFCYPNQFMHNPFNWGIFHQ